MMTQNNLYFTGLQNIQTAIILNSLFLVYYPFSYVCHVTVSSTRQMECSLGLPVTNRILFLNRFLRSVLCFVLLSNPTPLRSLCTFNPPKLQSRSSSLSDLLMRVEAKKVGGFKEIGGLHFPPTVKLKAVILHLKSHKIQIHQHLPFLLKFGVF